MQILVPIAERTQFFPQDEFYFPKPLIEIGGKVMIDLVVSNLARSIPNSRFHFVVSKDEAKRFSLENTLQLICGDHFASVFKRPKGGGGALCSALLAVDALDYEQPLIIANSDQVIDADLGQFIDQFQKQGTDAGVLTFQSVHPRWSYVVPGENHTVLEAVEKRVVSDKAIAGLYYFSSAKLFVKAAQDAILADDRCNDRFFITSSLNQIILAGKTVRYAEIDKSCYSSFYSPDKIEEYVSRKSIRDLGLDIDAAKKVQVVIPAAGNGSRFADAGWKKPKPFIDVAGKPMISHVVDNVAPRPFRPILLLRRQHLEGHPEICTDLMAGEAEILPVDILTEGTACTILLARRMLDPDLPVLVANSDQLVDFDCAAFVRDCLDRNLDGSILCFKDLDMDPKWSFAKLNADGLVERVAEKDPISDLATVGIYFFRRTKDFIAAAVDMIARNERVNNEFYTCPVYNFMIENGQKIGVYEIDRKAMHGLGIPEDLTSYLDHIGAKSSADQPA